VRAEYRHLENRLTQAEFECSKYKEDCDVMRRQNDTLATQNSQLDIQFKAVAEINSQLIQLLETFASKLPDDVRITVNVIIFDNISGTVHYTALRGIANAFPASNGFCMLSSGCSANSARVQAEDLPLPNFLVQSVCVW